MSKRGLLAVLVVFVTWGVLDYVIHAVILRSTYAATAHLWRPDAEMKIGLMYVTILITAFAFVFIYGRFFRERGAATGLQYGLWFGIAFGISMGYGSYSVMPIPYHLALIWFLGTVVEGAVGGLLTGLIVKP